MEHIEAFLLDEMSKAIEKKQELELQLLIAEKEYEAIRAAYRAHMGVVLSGQEEAEYE